MVDVVAGFSGFSVDNLDKAKDFYVKKLGLKLKDEKMGLLLELPDGGSVFVYNKDDHKPADYTMLNLVVSDIDKAVDQLKSEGIELEHYGFPYQDDKGVARGLSHDMGPDIAWFKDPAGNVVSVLQDK